MSRWFAAALAVGMLAVGAALAQDESGISIPEHGVGTDVVDRQLVGEKDSFTEGETAWFWTRVVGGEDGDRIRHVWLRDGQEMLSIGLTLGGSHWRTWSRKTLHPGSSGDWTVEAHDEDGRVLARASFTCAAPAEGP